MEKTIEQRIAEGVTKGIQQAKEQELEQKRKNKIGAFVGIVLSFVFVIAIGQIFGVSKPLYFVGGSVSCFAFQYLLNREEFKKHPFVTAIASCIFGFLFMQMV